jgi:hypothetical protein
MTQMHSPTVLFPSKKVISKMCSEGQSKQVPRQILPGNVKPSNYKLTITPAFETVEFSGTVHVL